MTDWYDIRENRRFRADDRAFDRLEAEERNSEYLIGEIAALVIALVFSPVVLSVFFYLITSTT